MAFPSETSVDAAPARGLKRVLGLRDLVSYGRMSVVYPMAGSVYSYVSRSINPHLGFLAGWSMFLNYLIIPALPIQRLAPDVILPRRGSLALSAREREQLATVRSRLEGMITPLFAAAGVSRC